MSDRKTYFSYARQSLGRPGERGDSISVADQHRSNIEAAERHGGRVVARYEDVDVSGAQEARDGLDRLLADLPRIKPHGVIIRDVSRLARDTRLFLSLVDTLQKQSIELVSATENIEDRVIATILSAMAERERLALAGRVAGGVREHARRGRHFGRPPYGYRRVDGALVIVEAEAAVVRQLYRRWLAGESAPSIAEALNADPLAPAAPGGGLWRRDVIAQMIRHRAYCGDIEIKAKRDIAGRHWPAVITQDAHPAIIDRPHWEAAQRRFQRQQRAIVREGRLSPFDGALVCDACGGRLYVFAYRRADRPGKPPVDRAIVRCSSYAKSMHAGPRVSRPCSGRVGSRELSVVAPLAKAAVDALLDRLAAPDELRRLAAEAMAERRQDGTMDLALARIAEIDRRRSRLLDAYEAGALDLLTWTGRDRALAEDEAAARAIIDAAPPETDVPSLLAIRAALADLPRAALDYAGLIAELGIAIRVDLDDLTAVAAPAEDLAPLFAPGVRAPH